MSNMDKIVGKAALLEQLAEEAAELAQAALKQARILRGDNPTPITEEEAHNNLIEEYTDVIHISRELGLLVDELQISYKSERWNTRILLQIMEGK